MLNVQMVRQTTGNQGTFGIMTVNGNLIHTGELPWRNNTSNMSSVPCGTYQCDWLLSPHFGVNLYHLKNVPFRENCMIHTGNWCGDTTKGLKSDVEGCILVGLGQGELEGQEAILRSKDALQLFNSQLNGASFMLTISERYEG
jgi:hypothetical protein